MSTTPLWQRCEVCGRTVNGDYPILQRYCHDQKMTWVRRTRLTFCAAGCGADVLFEGERCERCVAEEEYGGYDCTRGVEGCRNRVLEPGPCKGCIATLEYRRATRPPRKRKYRAKVKSRDGLLFADVVNAFAEAERLVGKGLKHKGHGHCRRVSLVPHYANYAVRGATNSVIRVRVPKSWNPRRLMPLVIVEKAAEILGVSSTLFVRREY